MSIAALKTAMDAQARIRASGLYSGPPAPGDFGGPPQTGGPPPSPNPSPIIPPRKNMLLSCNTRNGDKIHVKNTNLRWQSGKTDNISSMNKVGVQPPVDKGGDLQQNQRNPSMLDVKPPLGYERITEFGKCYTIHPPSTLYDPSEPTGDAPRVDVSRVLNLQDEDCRNSLMRFTAESFRYDTSVVRDMTITKVVPLSALHYTLETFCETRSFEYAYTPYRGEMLTVPNSSSPLQPWSVPCPPNHMFQNHEVSIEVPQTATILTCHECEGQGWSRCRRCRGWGEVRCRACEGTGRNKRRNDDVCIACDGQCQLRCSSCQGDGRVVCSQCDGYKKLKCYIHLTSTFKNHIDDFTQEKVDIPEEVFKKATSIVVFKQISDRVNPITTYPVQEINDNSARLTNKHKAEYQQEKCHHQKQQLTVVPVTEVHYTWKSYSGRFWVYGENRDVYAPDYPRLCAVCYIL